MTQRNPWRRSTMAVAFAAGTLAACSQQSNQAAEAPAVEDRSFALDPASVTVSVAFLTGRLEDMRVTDRVERETGEVVDPPKLRASLKLTNSGEEQSARLLGGSITYTDPEGRPIPLAEGRTDTSFQFYSYQTDQLNPGMETTQSIDVPFPAAALKDRKLGNIGLELRYMPLPYKEETATLPVSLKR